MNSLHSYYNRLSIFLFNSVAVILYVYAVNCSIGYLLFDWHLTHLIKKSKNSDALI